MGGIIGKENLILIPDTNYNEWTLARKNARYISKKLKKDGAFAARFNVGELTAFNIFFSEMTKARKGLYFTEGEELLNWQGGGDLLVAIEGVGSFAFNSPAFLISPEYFKQKFSFNFGEVVAKNIADFLTMLFSFYNSKEPEDLTEKELAKQRIVEDKKYIAALKKKLNEKTKRELIDELLSLKEVVEGRCNLMSLQRPFSRLESSTSINNHPITVLKNSAMGKKVKSIFN